MTSLLWGNVVDQNMDISFAWPWSYATNNQSAIPALGAITEPVTSLLVLTSTAQLAPCWILRSWPAVFLFPLLLSLIVGCLGFFGVKAPVTSLLPRLFYIWGYFRPWVWAIAGRYQMHQLLRCADPHQVTGSVDQRHSQEFSGIWWLGVRSPAAGSSTPHSACQVRHHCVSLDWIRLVLFRFRKV